MSSRISDRIEAVLGQRPDRLSALSGGCVGDVYKADLPDGRTIVAKAGDGPGSGLELEGRMLVYLDQHGLPVPGVLHADDTLLIMDMVEAGGGLNAQVQGHAAQLVAGLHAVTSSDGFGFAYDTVIGGLHQPNLQTPSWRTFFAEQRLIYMGREAERAGRLPTALLARLERFAAAIERWISEPEQPSLIHGDMWTGNVLAARGRITGFIDPAIYFADREIELAFTTLFGTFGDAFFGPYNEYFPIKAGFFEERRDIYNLYPLLVHVRLFGGSYVGSVERTLNQFGY